MVGAIILCIATIVLTSSLLGRFAVYTSRRAAAAERPGEFFISCWFETFLITVVAGMIGCLGLCWAFLHFIGGMA